MHLWILAMVVKSQVSRQFRTRCHEVPLEVKAAHTGHLQTCRSTCNANSCKQYKNERKPALVWNRERSVGAKTKSVHQELKVPLSKHPLLSNFGNNSSISSVGHVSCLSSNRSRRYVIDSSQHLRLSVLASSLTDGGTLNDVLMRVTHC